MLILLKAIARLAQGQSGLRKDDIDIVIMMGFLKGGRQPERGTSAVRI